MFVYICERYFHLVIGNKKQFVHKNKAEIAFAC